MSSQPTIEALRDLRAEGKRLELRLRESKDKLAKARQSIATEQLRLDTVKLLDELQLPQAVLVLIEQGDTLEKRRELAQGVAALIAKEVDRERAARPVEPADAHSRAPEYR